MKKKVLSKVLALAMAVAMTGSMIGCGSTPSTSSSQAQGGSSEASKSESSAPAESSSAAESSAEATAEPEANVNQPLPEWEAYDCKGATIRIAAEQIFDSTTEKDKDDPGRKNAYEKKWQWLHALEQKYNCKFEIVTLTTSEGIDEGTAILNAFTNGLGYADIFMKGPGVMIQNREFLATVENRDQLKMGSAFIDAASWNGVDYGFTYDNIGECFVLSYSRDYLKSIGMTKTPSDLFKEGKWSYEDAKAYLTELKGKLPDGTYPIALAPNHYAYMAGGTNGVMGITSKGEINMDDERYITALNFYKDLLDSGLAYPITGYTDNGDNTLTVADDAVMVYNLPDMAGYSGANTHVIATVQNWQQGDLAVNNTDWGIVPYPWGPEVSVEGFDEDGLPILKNYFVARVDFINVLVSGAKYRGEGSKDIPDWVLYQIVREYLDMNNANSTTPAGMVPGSGDGQAWINSYTLEKAGKSAGNVNFSPDDMRSFTQEVDRQIWNWMSKNVKIDFCAALNGGDYVPFSRNAYFVYAVGKDAKASGEALKAVGEANLKDQGLK